MTAKRKPLHTQALCRGCGKSDQVTIIDALAATAEAWVGGERVPFAPASDAPQRWTLVFCGRCMKVLGRPVLRTATECAAVGGIGTTHARLHPGTTDGRRQHP